ncbi:MAG TPA: hypothetical protein VN372_08000 [Methanospirillum sp.]|nr:hypothetical protein [Methanospirillum sp.]
MQGRGVREEKKTEKTRQQLLGEEWWTAEFLSRLDVGHNPTQLAKGRRFAEQGQVAVTSLFSGGVHSLVLDKNGGPHRASLWMTNLERGWRTVITILAENLPLWAELREGNFSSRLNELLIAAGVDLIPESMTDLDYRCDCETDTHICSHIIATYIALGKYINDDPFVLFLLRGKSKEDLLKAVEAYTPGGHDNDEELGTKDEEEDLPVDPATYYDPGPELEEVRIRQKIHQGKEKEIIERLGPSPFKIGQINLADAIGEMYPKAARLVTSTFLKTDKRSDEPEEKNQN